MSAVASFTLLPKSSLPGLREAAVILNHGYATGDRFWPYLQEHGTKVSTYDWSGYVFAVLLPYLEQKWDIDFMQPDFEDIGGFLSSVRKSTIFVLTTVHRQEHLEAIDPETFDEDELRRFFEEFNETVFEDAGKAMRDGIACLHESLSKVSEDSVVLVQIG